jgi:hypothetical protein
MANLAKIKQTNHMTIKACFLTDANRAEIAMAALVVGTSLPTQASVASWPSLKGEYVEPRSLPSVAFTPGGPLVYLWQKDSRFPIRPETPSKYDGRRPSLP